MHRARSDDSICASASTRPSRSRTLETHGSSDAIFGGGLPLPPPRDHSLKEHKWVITSAYLAINLVFNGGSYSLSKAIPKSHQRSAWHCPQSTHFQTTLCPCSWEFIRVEFSGGNSHQGSPRYAPDPQLIYSISLKIILFFFHLDDSGPSVSERSANSSGRSAGNSSANDTSSRHLLTSSSPEVSGNHSQQSALSHR